jgi:RND superfamily putative drug exporter
MLRSQTEPTSPSGPNHPARPSLIGRITRRVAGASATRPKTVIALWLLLVAGLVYTGGVVGTKTIGTADSGVGDSGLALEQLADAGLADPAVESVMIASDDPATTASAVAALNRKLAKLPQVGKVAGPADEPAQSAEDGRAALVQITLRGDPEKAGDHVGAIDGAIADLRRDDPGVSVYSTGQGSIDNAVDEVVEGDLQKAEMISLPITLVILFFAFGALVAASIPVLLGITAVAATFGLIGPISQIVPLSDVTFSLVILLGLAVGVDYSLFYIRREREERRAGRGPEAALNATSATVGRAIVISGSIVMIAMAGLTITGLNVFMSIAVGTIAVVAISVIGSVTVLPAVLAVLGDRIDRGRLPGMARASRRRQERRRRAAAAGRPFGLWARVVGAVTRRPLTALLTAVCLLGTIAVPALQMKLSDGNTGLPKDDPTVVALHKIEATFPSGPASSDLVVSGTDLGSPVASAGLQGLGAAALELTGGEGTPAIDVADSGALAKVTVPMDDRGPDGDERTVESLRSQLGSEVDAIGPGATMLVSGDAADGVDFTNRLATTTPIVIGLVLTLALAVTGLNLLSIGAAYGILTAVFQHQWAEGLLDFTSTGTITDWLPLNAFVILFGLSMDYTILVLERIRESRLAGRSPRAAAREAVAATAGTVTSAAVVMVAIFAIFLVLPLAEMKMFGIALASGVLIDATVVRGIALPAVVALLGERGISGARKTSRNGRRHAGRTMGPRPRAVTNDEIG